MASRSVEHKTTASCLLSLLGEGESDRVLRRELPGLYCNLSFVFEDDEVEREKGEGERKRVERLR